MRIAKSLTLPLIIAGLTTPAFAVEQGETYVGGGLGMINYEEDGVADAEPTALIGRLGYGVADNVAIEGRLGFGLTDDEVTIRGVDVDVEVDQVAGAYVVGYLPVADPFSVYGLAGLTYGELSANAFGLSFDEDDTDFSYGLGATVDLNDSVSGYAEWVQYFDESSYETSALTIGVNYHF